MFSLGLYPPIHVLEANFRRYFISTGTEHDVNKKLFPINHNPNPQSTKPNPESSHNILQPVTLVKTKQAKQYTKTPSISREKSQLFSY